MDTFLERIIRRVVSQIEANAFRYRDVLNLGGRLRITVVIADIRLAQVKSYIYYRSISWPKEDKTKLKTYK